MFLGGEVGRRWSRAGLLLLLLAGLVSYAFYRREEFPHGGSPQGLAFGIAGLVLLLVLLFFGVRKRLYRSTFGKLETWLHSHIWLGLLAMLLIVFHTGFRFEDDLAVAAFAAMAVVVASGIVGVFLYAVMPRFFTDVGSNPPAKDSSKELQQIARAMARTARGRSPELQKVFRSLAKQAKPPGWAGWRLLFSRARFRRGGEGMTAKLKGLVEAVDKAEEEPLRQLLVLSRQHGELQQRLAHQQLYRNWLDVWLWLHLPLSLALIVLVAAHVVAAAYYSGLLERWDLLGVFGLQAGE